MIVNALGDQDQQHIFRQFCFKASKEIKNICLDTEIWGKISLIF